MISVNPQAYSDGTYALLFIDPTPKQSKEFPLYQEFAAELGGGQVNVARDYFAPNATFQDLVTMFMHEMGHGLGLSTANYSFQDQSVSGSITIRTPLSCAGTVVPLATNNAGVTSHIDADAIPGLAGTGLGPLMSSWGNGERVYPSALDVLVIAQLSGF